MIQNELPNCSVCKTTFRSISILCYFFFHSTNNQMKAKLLPVLLLLLGLFSCNEEDPSPESKVQGAYEWVYQDNQSWSNDLFDYVNTFELKPDGTFYREDVTKNLDSDEVLGYRAYGKGTYSIVDRVVTFVYDDLYIMAVADLNYLPKDQLTLVEWEHPADSFRIVGDYTQLEQFCLPNANCASPIIYSRVD